MEFLSEDGKGDYIEIQGGVTPTQLQTAPCRPARASSGPSASAPSRWTPRRRTTRTTLPRARRRAKWLTSASPTAALQGDRRVPDCAGRRAGRRRCSIAGPAGAGCTKNGRAQDQPRTDVRGQRGRRGTAVDRVALCRHVFAGDVERAAAQLQRVGWLGGRRCESPRGCTEQRGCTISIWALRNWKGAIVGKACEHFELSLSLKDNAPAHRCLALHHSYAGDLEAAEAGYMRAWSLCGNDPNLAIEIGEFLFRIRRYDAFDAFCKIFAGGDRRPRADRVVEGADRLGARRVCRRPPVAAAGVSARSGRASSA